MEIVKAPVIVVGCKLDLHDEHYPVSLEQVMAPIMQQFREIETRIECSAANLVQKIIAFRLTELKRTVLGVIHVEMNKSSSDEEIVEYKV
ncbi:hypothetical protein Hanom_Chr10g00943931 [Helianthus anomalus]